MKKSALYRKVNTTAHGVHHRVGGEYRDDRQRIAGDDLGPSHLGMHGKKQRGLDYTPLFRFLLSKVGSSWNEVYSEAVARLDRPEPIFWLVALRQQDEQGYIRTGESSYFSGLRIDEAGVLQLVNADIGPHSLSPLCKCCTHTFNGTPFAKKFDPNAIPGSSAYRVA